MIGGDSLSGLAYTIISFDMIFCIPTWLLLHCYMKRIDYETIKIAKDVDQYNNFMKKN